jgi:hypothetical protein
VQRQRDELVVVVTVVHKQAQWRSSPQFAKGHFDGALGQLLDDPTAGQEKDCMPRTGRA